MWTRGLTNEVDDCSVIISLEDKQRTAIGPLSGTIYLTQNEHFCLQLGKTNIFCNKVSRVGESTPDDKCPVLLRLFHEPGGLRFLYKAESKLCKRGASLSEIGFFEQ